MGPGIPEGVGFGLNPLYPCKHVAIPTTVTGVELTQRRDRFPALTLSLSTTARTPKVDHNIVGKGGFIDQIFFPTHPRCSVIVNLFFP